MTDQKPFPSTISRRDWVILPLLSTLTIIVILASTEVAARLIWTEGGADSCRLKDPVIGQRYKPDCSERLKIPEGPWVEYTFNACGYRSTAPCGPKPPGVSRVVLMGSSTAEGFAIPYEQTFAAEANDELSGECQRPVQLENMGTVGGAPIYVYRRVKEALRLNPDVVVLPIAPFDVHLDISRELMANRNDPQAQVSGDAQPADPSWADWFGEALDGSRAKLISEHFLYEHKDTYVRLYLLQGDKAGFLRRPFPATWEARFANLDTLLGDMARQFHSAHVPFVLTAIPERAEAALLQEKNPPPGVDPYAFDRRMAEIAAKHGIIYIDLFGAFRRLPQPEDLFYPANGHLNPAGHAVVARGLTRGLLRANLTALSSCRVPDRPADR